MKKKFIYISHIAVPHQIKLCYAMQEYFDSEFWFYDASGGRPTWWAMDLGDKCKVLKNVFFKKKSKYLTFSHIPMLEKFNPDILMLGGFSVPANLFAYWWAKKNGKKVVLFTERSRDSNGNLRKNNWVWKCFKYLYKDIDLILVSAEDIVPQFRYEFGFGNKVVASQYASDIDDYLNHKMRIPKVAYNYLYPNRLTEIYNPIGAIDIFATIQKKYNGSHLFMNASGELRSICGEYIKILNLENNISFLDNITSWSDLHKEYERCDIMLLPAHFSNGNFTIIEAMASGMGIVISEKILGVGKLIEHEVNGFNCQHSPQEYVSAVQAYIENPSLFFTHATLNKKKVSSLSVQATAKLYHEQLTYHLF